MLSTLKNNMTVSTAASSTLMTRMSKNAGINFTSAIVEVVLKDPKMDKLIKLEAFIQYLDQIKNKRVKDYIREARTFLSRLIIEFEGTKEYYLPWVRFLDIVYIHKMNKPPGEQEDAFKEGIEEILKEFLAKYIKAKTIDWRIARKILSLYGHFSLAEDDMKDFEECILKALKVEIGIALEYLLWKEYLFVTTTTTALMSIYQCYVEIEKGQDQGEKNLLEAILCGRFDKEKFKLENSIVIGEDGGLYMLLNRLNQQEQDALITEQIVTSEYIKDKIKEKDEGNGKGDKIVLGTGGFGTVRFALSLLRSRSLPGEIVCVKKTRSFQELGGDYKPTALEQVTESTLGDYFTNDRAQAIYSPCILDMSLITTKKVIKDDTKDHRKGYLMMEILPQNTATRIFAEERFQKWEYQKPYLLDVLENTQKLLESSIAMTDLKPDNTLYDTDTRKATIIDLGGSVKVASAKDLFTFDIQKYSFQSTPQFRAPELGGSKGVINMYKSLAYSCGKVIEAVTTKTDADRQRISQLIKKLTTTEPLPRISLLDAINEIKGMGDDSYRKNIIFSHYINKVKDRLEHKKSAISINEDIEKTRELFINLNSTSLDPSKYKNQKTEDLLRKIDNFLAPENSKQVMAVFGIAGSGKSIALQLKFMDAVYAWEPGQPLPIYFNLANGIELDQIIRILNTELDTNLSLAGLDSPHLYIDSFDEGLGIEHKRDTLIKDYFRQVGSPKILITCRTDYIQDNSQDWFSPESKELELCYVAPINYNGHQDLSNMIKKYVSYSKRHTSTQQDATPNTTEDYLKRLKQLQLTDLINTGFMFFLVMEVLFQLQDKKEGRVNQVDIYATYISHYQKSQIARLKPEQKKRLTEMIPISKENRQPDDLCLFATELGKYLACQMHLLDQSRLGTLDLDKVFAALGYDSSLLFKHQSIIQILKLLPLKIVTTHSGKRFISNQEVKIGFIHETIKNYYLLEAIKSEIDKEDKSQILASQSIIHDSELVKLIALGIIGNPKLTTAFLKAIENSKRDKSATSVINASNSITLLVAARHSFSGYDLNNIAVKGANIVNGIFHYANLDNADLSKVEMSNVNLIGASLNGADMRGVNFSIFPDLIGHTGEVTSVSLSLDGKFLASGSWDNRIKIWDPKTGECLKTLSGHNHHINTVNFSPNGKFLASGSRDKTVKIWNLSTGACVLTLGGHSGSVYSVCFSSDGKQLASVSEDEKLKIWNATSGECIHTLFGHRQPINSVTYSRDGKFIATGSDDETIKIWDADSGVCRHTLESASTVCSVSFSLDSKFLASGLGFPHPTIKLWNPISGECLQTLTGHTDQVKSVSFSPDGKFLVSGSQGKTIKIWNISTSECLQTLNGHTNEVRSVSYSPDGKFIASGSDDKTIKIWSPSAGECLQGLYGHIQRVSSVSYSYDSKFLASGSEDKTIKIWNPSTGECLQTLDTKSVNSVSFSPDGKFLASGSWDTSVKIWNLYTGQCLQELDGHSGSIYSVSFSPDGKSLASGSGGQTIKIWDLSSGKCLQTLNGHNKEVFSVVFSSDSNLLASGSWDDKIKIWNPKTGECVRTLTGHKSYVYSISFSPDNKFLASGSYDQTIKIWDLSTGDCLHTLNKHAGRVYSVSFSPDGKFLASGSQDHTIKIWDPSTGKCLQDIIAHTGEVNSVSFSPDGKSLASGSTDKTIDIFEFEAKSNTWLLKTNITATLSPLLAVGASFKDTSISQNNKLILTQKKGDTTSSVISNTTNQTQHHLDTSPESHKTAKQLSQAFLEKLITHQQSQDSKFFIFSVYTEEIPVEIPTPDQREETQQDFTPALSENSPDHKTKTLTPKNPPEHSFKDNHRATACCQMF